MDLTTTHAFVTGGGTGIGLGIARALSAGGARVTICGRREAVLRQAQEAHPELTLQTCVLDVTDREAVATVFSELRSLGRAPEILVNCAGVNIRNRSMAEMTPDQWDIVLSVNATGAYNCMHAALPAMREAGEGLIVNVCSVAGKRALPMAGIAYAASKFAVAALGTGVGLEEAANGIRVSNIYPGEVDTPILEQRPKPVPPHKRAQMVKPEHIGRAVRMIAELPQAAHIPEVVIKPLYQEYM